VIDIYDKTSGRSVRRHLPDPNALQAQLLRAAGVTLPKTPPKNLVRRAGHRRSQQRYPMPVV